MAKWSLADDLKLLVSYEGVCFEGIDNTNSRLTSCNGTFVSLNVGGNEVIVKVQRNPYSRFKFGISECVINKRSQSFKISRIQQAVPYVDRILSTQLNDVVAASVAGCELVNYGNQCLFCGSPPFDGLRFSVSDFGESLTLNRIGLTSNQCCIINSGSLQSNSESSYNLMRQYVQEASRKGVRRIHVEIMPVANYPVDRIRELCETMVDDGVTSVQLNIEFLDNEKRHKLMPFKGKITLDEYYRWMSLFVEYLGRGKVYSVIIVNLCGTDGLLTSTKDLLDIGVIPSLEVLRNSFLSGCVLSPHLVPLEEALVSLQSGYQMIYESDVYDMNALEGCAQCGGCNWLRR